MNLKPEEMASKVRQEENQKIRDAAMFEAERGQKRMATNSTLLNAGPYPAVTMIYSIKRSKAINFGKLILIAELCLRSYSTVIQSFSLT